MNDIERRIKEERTIQAVDRNLMGMQGKIGCILRNLGQPIIQEGGGYCETNYLDAPWYDDLPDNNSDIQEAEDSHQIVIGWFFDGTTSGIHLEITYFTKYSELKASWHGYVVYSEIKGDLRTYVPGDDWELQVESLYHVAKKRERINQMIEQVEKQKEADEEKVGFLDKLKRFWGVG